MIPFGNLFSKFSYSEEINKFTYQKILPDFDSLFEIVTPGALAYWICDDGLQVKKGGVTLCTDNFSKEEVLLLKSVCF